MTLDLILRDARPMDRPSDAPTVDIGVANGQISAIEPDLGDGAEVIEAGGRLVSPGLIESHIHLDKSRILDRCPAGTKGTMDHMERISEVKHHFTVEDVHNRAGQTIEDCLLHGTMHMRTHVEVDPNGGLRGFEAITQLADEYRWAIDLDICVFAQEGWSNVPEVDANIVSALKSGAPVVGGAPKFDPDPEWQIRRIFELAQEYDVDVDIHLDTGLASDHLDVLLVCDLADEIGWGGRVAVGHGSRYSSLAPNKLADLGQRLAGSGVATTVLPTTDLYVVGRDMDRAVPRGVADANALIDQGANCCLSTNNVLNPFTPYGDGSLMRMANLYANIVQRGTDRELEQCFEMLSVRPAKLLGREGYAVAVGTPADLVVWDATSMVEAVATIAPALFGFKRGRRSFTREVPVLHRP
ncbi:MAG: amidohydrolase family protein [Rhodospirillaceae bacterium]|jgi:cytosine/creatinine deaminase|nr:amidohydrolase family protein [Rhodospirillaceae bacterium]MBT6137718.1 amidohydrolase family protein [Rhodospirillaceae bacterium]